MGNADFSKYSDVIIQAQRAQSAKFLPVFTHNNEDFYGQKPLKNTEL